MGTSKIHDHAKSLKAKQDAKKALEIELLREAQRQSDALPKAVPLRRAVKVEGQIDWERPAPQSTADSTHDSGGEANATAWEEQWRPSTELITDYADRMIPELITALNQHEQEGEPAVILPEGRTEARDYLVGRLEALQTRYQPFFASFAEWDRRHGALPTSSYGAMRSNRPEPALDLHSVSTAIAQPLNALRSLPPLPTGNIETATAAALEQAARIIRQWDAVLTSTLFSVEGVIRALAGVRERAPKVVAEIDRFSMTQRLSPWSRVTPLHPLNQYGMARIPVAAD